ncbi:hypothetical protein JRQ81_003401 [Phrynocephalus forsythii]|uniref:Uncharacterized protein n=1 Tax=Phrynocephalus forsythii TaxID=171643 RepID=A0A9Q0XJP9_9SAUR|nr:hypothetical protein JRQ81_003401 [Phrynocephalus forsythii]
MLVLDEEDQNKSIPMTKTSFWKRSWRSLSQNSAELCLSFEKSIECSVPRFFHRSTMTKIVRPLIKRRPNSLLLIVLILLSMMLFINMSPMCPQYCCETEGNTKVAIKVAPKNLTLGTLLAAEREEPRGGALRDCLEKAVQEFSEEPSIIQNNAKMTLHCNGTKREFLSGRGENLIEVVWIDGKVSYALVHEAHPDVHLTRLGRHPLPLSLSSIVDILQDVSSHNGSEVLRGCLRKALEQLPQEPEELQHNAKMVVSCDGKRFTFISGAGQAEIIVFREEPHGEIRYLAKAVGRAPWFGFLKRGNLNSKNGGSHADKRCMALLTFMLFLGLHV